MKNENIVDTAAVAFVIGLAVAAFVGYSVVTSLLAGPVSGPLLGAAAAFKLQGK